MISTRWYLILSRRVRAVFRGRALDLELDEELRYHFERSVEANLARGLPSDAARREALLALGGIEQRKEECRDTRRVRVFHDVLSDVRYAVRGLRHSPAFSIPALVTLTLGIGVSVAVFSVIYGVLLRPLPFPEPHRLLLVAISPRSPFIREPVLSDRNFIALREHDRAFEHLATYTKFNGNLTNAGEPVVLSVAGVSDWFFPALGIAPELGRIFFPGEGAKGREPTMIIAERLWRSRFEADRSVIGRQVTLNGIGHVIIGVMPATFDFPAKVDAWTPQEVRLDPGNSFMNPVFGRLRHGVGIDEARAQFDAIIPSLPQQPDANRASWQIGLLPLKESVVASVRRPLQVFAGAVILVLLIACANVANLLLVRAAHRQHELAVRTALGASRGRLIRQFLTESTVLALIGGFLGLLVTRWTVPALLTLAPEGRIPRVEMIQIDGWVVLYALAASLATGTVFGLLPALRFTRGRATDSLGPGVRRFGGGQERLRTILVVSEIALALVLLTGAGLMLRSVILLRSVDPGFDAANVITLNLELPQSVYSTPEKPTSSIRTC
jgi:putative ABC transport system permease protein